MRKCIKEKNILLFGSGGNIRMDNNVLKNRIYQENYDLPDQHSTYSLRSVANDKNDNITDKHLILTFGTNKDGDIDQTNEIYESSKFPVGFHYDILFAGRAFPFKSHNS